MLKVIITVIVVLGLAGGVAVLAAHTTSPGA